MFSGTCALDAALLHHMTQGFWLLPRLQRLCKGSRCSAAAKRFRILHAQLTCSVHWRPPSTGNNRLRPNSYHGSTYELFQLGLLLRRLPSWCWWECDAAVEQPQANFGRLACWKQIYPRRCYDACFFFFFCCAGYWKQPLALWLIFDSISPKLPIFRINEVRNRKGVKQLTFKDGSEGDGAWFLGSLC